MARGWESKSVESQQEQAAVDARTGERVVTAEERERIARRGTLALARAKALAELKRATVPAHRAMLQQALDALEQQLRES